MVAGFKRGEMDSGGIGWMGEFYLMWTKSAVYYDFQMV